MVSMAMTMWWCEGCIDIYIQLFHAAQTESHVLFDSGDTIGAADHGINCVCCVFNTSFYL